MPEGTRNYFLTPPDLEKLQQVSRTPCPIRISLDIGKSWVEGIIEEQYLKVQDISLPLPDPTLVQSNDFRTILIFRPTGWEKWQYFDPQTNRLYKPVFVKEGKPPTVEISGIKMHVTENGDPWKDTRQKLRFLKSVRGIVWDTCCGMGYSAMGLATLPGVDQVISSEVDMTMLTLCRENPWAVDLWHNPAIQVVQANAAEFVNMIADRSLGGVLHDPPRYALAPVLYEEQFYRQLWRVMKHGARLYHYTGNPRKHQARGLPHRTAERLRKVGFQNVRMCYQGVCAIKKL